MVLVGTGAGIAFFILMAARSRNALLIASTARHVVLADWLFTTPAVLTQFVTGIWLMELNGYSYSSVWFLLVVSLFILIGLCWVPVVFMQYRLHALAKTTLEGGELPMEFSQLFRRWVALGVPAFIAILGLVYLMVFKPYL